MNEQEYEMIPKQIPLKFNYTLISFIAFEIDFSLYENPNTILNRLNLHPKD